MGKKRQGTNTHISKLQCIRDICFCSRQVYLFPKQLARALHLALLQADLCKGRDRSLALRIKLKGLADNLLRLIKIILPLEDRQALVHHRQHVDGRFPGLLDFNCPVEFFDGVFEALLVQEELAAVQVRKMGDVSHGLKC